MYFNHTCRNTLCTYRIAHTHSYTIHLCMYALGLKQYIVCILHIVYIVLYCIILYTYIYTVYCINISNTYYIATYVRIYTTETDGWIGAHTIDTDGCIEAHTSPDIWMDRSTHVLHQTDRWIEAHYTRQTDG